ncbi:hypothetical protein XBP1_2440002 [Xenorhabdus bovienii str. puntauvense]|uniref:Uncharacterized protein n=2 Tax=Xenorhabdus bovienii TaxID=40576 RepID=A0A077N4J9_XENBV|nr:hypothetical protein XBFFR1_510003 [Xenorhabdus bovienii str. feltiae France]CDG93777.1 hypothetical protein XBFFL1_2680023 [Xenorhabdus bovienii str. feltiae Florida]CDG97071.1 hypothetical protein XBP1_2440002 [Xenorhabdus bovienii str. puntauvense]CDH03878.1 hypothetical protein XBFM1_860072 [Xenorhabdus bovienii str. feltiae Moldova]
MNEKQKEKEHRKDNNYPAELIERV